MPELDSSDTKECRSSRGVQVWGFEPGSGDNQPEGSLHIGRVQLCTDLCREDEIVILPRIPAGEHQVRMEFANDGGGLGKGGTVSLYLDGDKIGEGRIDRTQPIDFSLDDKTDVGSDRCTPFSDDYESADSDFNGRIDWIQIDLGKDAEDADHLITPEEQYQHLVAPQ